LKILGNLRGVSGPTSSHFLDTGECSFYLIITAPSQALSWSRV